MVWNWAEEPGVASVDILWMLMLMLLMLLMLLMKVDERGGEVRLSIVPDDGPCN